MSNNNQEVEVFRSSLTVGKHYETADYTRKTGTWGERNERFFTTQTPRYVGRFIKTESSGYGDGCHVWSIFDNDGKQVHVAYNYEGTTSFRETNQNKPL